MGQKTPRELITVLEERWTNRNTQVENFIAKCNRYSGPEKLTPAILTGFVSKVFKVFM